MKPLLSILAPLTLLLCACDNGTVIYLPAEQVDGAYTGMPVSVSGVQVGKTLDIELDEQLNCWLTLQIDEPYEISREANFYLETISILGARAITIENSEKGEVISHGDSLKSPIIVKSIFETFGAPVDSTEQAELSEKMEELLDLLIESVKE